MIEIKKNYLKLNLLLAFLYQPAILFAMAMSISQANSANEIISNLYWVLPMHIILGSIPNVILFAVHLTSRIKGKQAIRAFLFGTTLVVVIQSILYIFMFLLFTYGPNI